MVTSSAQRSSRFGLTRPPSCPTSTIQTRSGSAPGGSACLLVESDRSSARCRCLAFRNSFQAWRRSRRRRNQKASKRLILAKMRACFKASKVFWYAKQKKKIEKKFLKIFFFEIKEENILIFSGIPFFSGLRSAALLMATFLQPS